MEQIEILKKSLETDRPNQWKDIPDIELYMDQVISYMPRQHVGLNSNEALTSAMINNYIKKGLLPRANGKKYDREHLAYLTAICLFKQVLSVTDTDHLLKLQAEHQSINDFYDKYCEHLDVALTDVSHCLKVNMTKEELSDLTLELAISAYAQKLVCEQLLAILQEV